MIFNRITHYLDNDEGTIHPSFIVEMIKDGKKVSFVSWFNHFIELKDSNISLIDSLRFDYSNLCSSPLVSNDELIFLNYLFNGCDEVTSCNLVADYVETATSAFDGCTKIVECILTLKRLENAEYMMADCASMTDFQLKAPRLKYAHYMMFRCSCVVGFGLVALSLITLYSMFEECTLMKNLSLTIGRKNEKKLKREHMIFGCISLEQMEISFV